MPDQNISFPTQEAPAAPYGEMKKPVQAPVAPEPEAEPTAPEPSGLGTGAGVAQGVPGPETPSIPTNPVGPPSQTTLTPEPPMPTEKPKRRFPIKIIFIILALLVISVLGYLGLKLIRQKVPTTPLAENTLIWWGLWEDSSIVTPLIDEYQAKNPNIKIEYVRQSPKDYRERLESSLSKGNGPDIFFFHNTWTPMFKDKLNKVPAGVMSAGEFAQTFYPIVASDVTSGTGLVGIPLGYDALTLYINQDIFDAAGKTPPETWDELRNTAKTLTIKDEDGVITQSGVALGITQNIDHWQEILALMMLQNGANLAEPTGELAQKALDFYTLFYKTDKVWNETLPNSTIAFAAGKVAMIFGPSWRAFEIKEQNPSLRFRAVSPPHLPKEDLTQADIAYATYWLQGVYDGSRQKDTAWDFLKFISTKESLEKLFANASKVRLFGEPYPRVDMAELLNDHPLLGAIVNQAPNARSWYLAARTFDGPTGINSQINKYYEDAVNAVSKGGDTTDALTATAEGVAQILAQFKVSSP